MTRETDAERPTWLLGGKDLPATYPAETLDPAEAIAKALATEKAWERGRDITDFIGAAAAYHVEAARDGYIALAMMFRGGMATDPDGWTHEVRASAEPSTVNVLLRPEGKPGAIHVSISARKEMTEKARARCNELHKEINSELEAKGINPAGRALKRMLGKVDLMPAERSLNTLSKDPESYRPLLSGDHLDSVEVHAIEMNGIMEGLTSWDVEKIDELEKDLRGTGYHRGKQIRMSPSLSILQDDDMISTSAPLDVSGCAEILLPVLAEYLRENGMGGATAGASHGISEKSWKCTGGEADALLQEAAHAVVFRQGGMFDSTVLDAVKTFSAGLAEHDFRRLQVTFQELAEELLAHDFTSRESRFDANDGRDDAYVSSENGKPCIYNQTQNGLFRMEIGLDGEPAYFEFTEVESGTPRIYARFAMSDDEWVQDYDGRLTGREPVAYHIENVKSFNYSIGGFASLHCVLEEEFGRQEGADDPTP